MLFGYCFRTGRICCVRVWKTCSFSVLLKHEVIDRVWSSMVTRFDVFVCLFVSLFLPFFLSLFFYLLLAVQLWIGGLTLFMVSRYIIFSLNIHACHALIYSFFLVSINGSFNFSSLLFFFRLFQQICVQCVHIFVYRCLWTCIIPAGILPCINFLP